MGLLNVTPDSFSDGGRYLAPDLAVQRALQMAQEGARIIDIGGESTRPGAEEVPVEVECERVLPVIRGLRGRLDCPISVDTRKAAVAQRALESGAAIINDVSSLPGAPSGGGAGGGNCEVADHSRSRHWICQENQSQFEVVSRVAAALPARISGTGRRLAQEFYPPNRRSRAGTIAFRHYRRRIPGNSRRRRDRAGPRSPDCGGGQGGGGNCGRWRAISHVLANF